MCSPIAGDTRPSGALSHNGSEGLDAAEAGRCGAQIMRDKDKTLATLTREEWELDPAEPAGTRGRPCWSRSRIFQWGFGNRPSQLVEGLA